MSSTESDIEYSECDFLCDWCDDEDAYNVLLCVVCNGCVCNDCARFCMHDECNDFYCPACECEHM